MATSSETPGLYEVMDAFLRDNQEGVTRDSVANFVRQLGPHMFGGTQQEIDEIRIKGAQSMVEDGRPDTAIAKHNGAFLELWGRASRLEGLLASYTQLIELPVPPCIPEIEAVSDAYETKSAQAIS